MSASSSTRISNHLLRPELWPRQDADLFEAGVAARQSPFRRRGGGAARSSFTYQRYRDCYAAWAYFLSMRGELDPTVPPWDRVTLERLDANWLHLEACGNADHTIVNRFCGLQGALELMRPGHDFAFVTKPMGVSIRRGLRMRRRSVFVPDARHCALWAQELFATGLKEANAFKRCLAVRDAALLAVAATRAPRTRATQAQRLQKEVRREHGTWVLLQRELNTKIGNVIELPLGSRVSRILDRYVQVERQELLRGRETDALWVTSRGRPLSRRGLQNMVRRRSTAQWGIGHGLHRFRTALATTAAIAASDMPFLAPTILGNNPQTSLRAYNRAKGFAVTMAHAELIDAMEAAAWNRHCPAVDGDAIAEEPARRPRTRQAPEPKQLRLFE